MPIYEPVAFDGAGIYSGNFGKNVATAPNQRFATGFTSGKGRFATIIQGGYRASRYFKRHRNAYTAVGAIATGAYVRYATSNQKRQTLHTFANNRYRKQRKTRYKSRNNSRRGCCSCCCN